MTKYGKRGSTFRGRICYCIHSVDEEGFQEQKKSLNLKTRKDTLSPPELLKYHLYCDLFEGHELPIRDYLYVQVTCGVHKCHSKAGDMKKNSSFATWYQSLKEITMEFPEEANQIPDIFIYLATDDTETSRICYARVKYNIYTIYIYIYI